MSDTSIDVTPYIIGPAATHFMSPFQPPGVFFDGTTSWLDRAGTMTGVTDTKVGLISLWFKVGGVDGNNYYLLAFRDVTLGNMTVNLIRDSNNRMTLTGYNSAGVVVLLMTTASTFTSTMPWTHFAAWYDLSLSTGGIYINGTLNLSSMFTLSVNIDQSAVGGDWAIGNSLTAFLTPGALWFPGSLSQLYFNSQQTLNLVSIGNLRKFISAGGHPVDLGPTGSLPTLTQPVLYLNNTAATWGTNLGSGGNYTATAITDVPGPI